MRQLNYSKVVLHVCMHVCDKMDPDMESDHRKKRDNQIMIKTKQMVT